MTIEEIAQEQEAEQILRRRDLKRGFWRNKIFIAT